MWGGKGRSRRLATHRLAIVVSAAWVCVSPPPRITRGSKQRSTTGRQVSTQHISRIFALREGRAHSQIFSVRNGYGVDRPQPKQSSRIKALMQQKTMVRGFQT